MNNHLPDGYYSDGESLWAGAEEKEDATLIISDDGMIVRGATISSNFKRDAVYKASKGFEYGEDWESLLVAIAGDKESYTKEEVLHAMWMTEQETIWEQHPENPMNEEDTIGLLEWFSPKHISLLPQYSVNARPEPDIDGTIIVNSDNDALEVANNNEWITVYQKDGLVKILENIN